MTPFTGEKPELDDRNGQGCATGKGSTPHRSAYASATGKWTSSCRRLPRIDTATNVDLHASNDGENRFICELIKLRLCGPADDAVVGVMKENVGGKVG